MWIVTVPALLELPELAAPELALEATLDAVLALAAEAADDDAPLLAELLVSPPPPHAARHTKDSMAKPCLNNLLIPISPRFRRFLTTLPFEENKAVTGHKPDRNCAFDAALRRTDFETPVGRTESAWPAALSFRLRPVASPYR
jgi:hypothetical protein